MTNINQAIKLRKHIQSADQSCGPDGIADYKGCKLRFSPSRDTLTISKGDADSEVWEAGEFERANHKAHYINDSLGAEGLTKDWSDEDWKPVEGHAKNYRIACDRTLWDEYVDPDGITDNDEWHDSTVPDRIAAIEDMGC
jgi:hypothetical protein|tara:strand:- start:3743 stop:4162 length:420 start_codon:yes stop_codon:yes gene_type:complete